MIEFYGNKIWNDAIDNSCKAYYVMQQTAFDEVAKLLEENGLNYYAFSQDGTVKMAVNAADVDYFREIIGTSLSKSMDVVSTAKSNAPSTIFGTTEYRRIADKRYFSADIDTALKIAEQLRLSDVSFSGRIYDDHATLTVTRSDEQLLHEIQNALINQRQKHHHRTAQSMIVGNVPLSDIKNRIHLIAPLTPDVFLAMKPEIDRAGIPYSGIVKADHTLLTVDAAHHEAFQAMLNALTVKPVLIEELQAEGFTERQIALLDSTISAYAMHGQDEYLSFHLDKRMSDDQLLEMAELLQNYIMQSEAERVLDKNGVMLSICRKHDAYKQELDFYEAIADSDFSAEQKQHLFAANQQGINIDALIYAFDSSYSVAEIDAIVAQIHSGDIEAVRELQEQHSHAQLVQVSDPEQIPDTAMTAQMHSYEAESQRDVPLTRVHALTELPAAEPVPQDTYEIFRLIEQDSITHDYRFESLDRLQKRGLSVQPEHYESIYTGAMQEDTTLDSIYEAFNIHHPEDFTGYSLSVGDIIVLNQGGSRKAMFVDSFGFTELPDFFREQSLQQERAAEPADLYALPYSDASKGVIGNTPFRFIAGKTYHKLDTESALKISALLAAQETPFSAKIGKHGTTTITVPATAEEAYLAAAETVKQQLIAEINARCFVGTSQSEKTAYFILPDKPLTMDSLRELKATGNLSEHTVICAAVSYLSDEQQRQEGIVFKKFGRDLPVLEVKPTVADLQKALRDQAEQNRTEEAQIAALQGEARLNEMLTQAAATAEPSAEQATLQVGDHIETGGKRWAITAIQDDFSIHLKNLDPNDIQAVQAIFGHWKDQLTYTLLPEKGIPEEPVKRRGRSQRKTANVQPEQMALGTEPDAELEKGNAVLSFSKLFEAYLAKQTDSVRFERLSPVQRGRLQQQYWGETTNENAMHWRDVLSPISQEYVAYLDDFVAFGLDVLDDEFSAMVRAEKERANAPFEAIAANYWGDSAAFDKTMHLVTAPFASIDTPKIPVAESETAKVIIDTYSSYFSQIRQAAISEQAGNTNVDFFSEYADLLRRNAMESGAVYHAALHSDVENTKLEIQSELTRALTALLTESPEQYGVLFDAVQRDAELRSRFEADILETTMHQAERTEATRKAAAAAGIPFSETLSNGADDEINPFVYDGSMTPEDFRKVQDAHFWESYLNNEQDFSVILDKTFARDEMEEFEQYRHAAPEQWAEVAKKALYDGGCMIHLSELSSSAVLQTKKFEDGAMFSFEQLPETAVKYSWEEIGGFLSAAVERYVVAEEKAEQAYQDGLTTEQSQKSLKQQPAPEDALHAFAERIGVDETMLRDMMQGNHTEQSINEYGRFDRLKETVNKETAAAYIKSREGEDFPMHRVHILVDKYLRAAILTGKLPEELTEPAHTPTYSADGVLLEADSVQQFDDAVKDGKTVSLLGLSHAMEKENAAQMPLDRPSAAESQPDRQNYRITPDSLGAGGAKTKFQNNVAALRLLNTLTLENRLATPQEQETLAKYVGWGGLPQAFDADNTQWAAEFRELQALLSPEEYDAARASTLNAHYTSPVVIDAMYEALSNLGFEGGRILEPAMGIGNFFGTMPEEMQRNSQLFGVELDGVTGRIAKQLYQDADIQVTGFEKTGFANDSFDVAVGNVPFGSYKVLDKEYDQHNFMIHDYFFAKSLDKVKPGGIIAFVTSTGTLDKQNPAVRDYLAERAELLGAIRLPNNAFKANAGTEVTTDILFLQKRTEPMQSLPEWVQLGQTTDGLPINQYFAAHPEMVLGTIVEGNKLYGSSSGIDTMCIPLEGANLKTQLHEAVARIHGQISQEKAVVSEAAARSGLPEIPAQTYTEIDGNIYFRSGNEATRLWEQNASAIPKQRMLGMIAIRDTTRALLDAQLQDAPDAPLHALQARLTEQYDTFYKKFGLLHSSANKQVFRDDAAYSLICSLEKKYTKDQLIAKSDIFTERTIRPPKRIDHVDTAKDALTVSIQEFARVDLGFMEQLSGFTKEELLKELREKIYPVPEGDSSEIRYQTADEYLSGNIRKKLVAAKAAAADNPIFAQNVPALEAVMPEPLKAGEIDARLGATWIDPKYVQQFMYEVLQTPQVNQADQSSSRLPFLRKLHIEVDYSPAANAWNISNKNADRQSVAAHKTYGTKDASAYQILEDVLNLRDPKVYKTVTDAEGKEKRVLDADATKLASRKAELIRTKFQDWVFKDPERRADLVAEYNKRFNSIRPREYDGSHLEFPGMNETIHLHDHQKNAIAHALYGGNTLFAHSVGAGKTFEMIATAMEGKRLGQHAKAMFVVPKHLTEQVGEDFLKLYPAANVLVATNKDFKAENRRELMARIATGNYDAIVISHSQFGLIPLSKERQEAAIRDQIHTLVDSIAQLKRENGSSFQVKAMERMKKTLDNNLKKLTESMAKDENNVTFEELGVDKLFVDEAHEFKNLFSPTKLQNVAGISSSASQKAMDLFLKCRYLDEFTGSRGVVFATGTPVSNTVTELHTMMRYLQHETLQAAGLEAFDSWVSVFGKPATEYELAPAGNKWRMKTRIASYSNLPELISMFKQCADVKTADTLQLKVPDCELHIVETEATPFQQELVAELSDRADDVQAGSVPPEEDNMLRITGDGRKVGLDPRLIDPDFEDNPATKLNQCVRNVAEIWEQTAQGRSAQIIFCDLGVPHKQPSAKKGKETDEKPNELSISEQDSLEEECPFCVYEDIRQKLMDKGIPKEEIAFIHDANSEAQKAALFEKVRSGEVRILIGSTSKMGTGTNVQDKLVALHDLDIPWRPSDLEQRRGRMVRQGNANDKVHLYRYVTKGTFDAYSYQTLEKKQKFISQVVTSKSPARSCEDIDQAALTFSEIKAICTGDERIKEKMTLDNEVKELQLLKSEYVNTKYYLEDKERKFPQREQQLNERIEALQTDISRVEALPKDSDGLPQLTFTLDETIYTDKAEVAKVLSEKCTLTLGHPDTDIRIGVVSGFPLSICQSSFQERITATLHGTIPYTMEFGSSSSYNVKRLENMLSGMKNLLHEATAERAQLIVEHEDAIKALQQPFDKESELQEKSERLSVLNDELQEAAKEAAANRVERPRTLYFSRDKLRELTAGVTGKHQTAQEPPKKETVIGE